MSICTMNNMPICHNVVMLYHMHAVWFSIRSAPLPSSQACPRGEPWYLEVRYTTKLVRTAHGRIEFCLVWVSHDHAVDAAVGIIRTTMMWLG